MARWGDRALEGFARAGFMAAEVWAQHLWENDTKPEVVAARAAELGMRLSLHAPSYDLNPLSSNPEVRAISRRQVLESLETAMRVGARIVVVHPGHISSSTDNVEDYWAGLAEYAAQLNARASELGLTVALEAMEKKRLQFVTNIPALQRLGAILEGLEHTVIAVDIAHAGTMGDPMEFWSACHASVTRIYRTRARRRRTPCWVRADWICRASFPRSSIASRRRRTG
ncbi:MAG: sugar phosphate isomerase/epimerase [Pleurocapsa sp. SU_196_0]|nr:sugar phosphate isomerase/epimerase [Pleurocapsa sp. SU_196_0]